MSDTEQAQSVLVTAFPALGKGSAVSNPETVKNINAVQSAFTAFMSMVALVGVSTGYIDNDSAQRIVMLVSSLWVTGSALFSAVSTLITSKKVGF